MIFVVYGGMEAEECGQEKFRNVILAVFHSVALIFENDLAGSGRRVRGRGAGLGGFGHGGSCGAPVPRMCACGGIAGNGDLPQGIIGKIQALFVATATNNA